MWKVWYIVVYVTSCWCGTKTSLFFVVCLPCFSLISQICHWVEKCTAGWELISAVIFVLSRVLSELKKCTTRSCFFTAWQQNVQWCCRPCDVTAVLFGLNFKLKRTAEASRGFPATARLSCYLFHQKVEAVFVHTKHRLILCFFIAFQL